MSSTAKYVWAALILAVLTHFAVLHAVPRALMHVAIERIGGGVSNMWRVADRVTPLSRTIVRPSPDFAYSACAYDLRAGPVHITASAWDRYWSLSLYAANSDNYYVLDDRDARGGADITLIRAGQAHPDDAANVVESPTTQGIALIRRLAPDLESYNAAVEVARGDVCAAVAAH